jgi:hypothetical protein
MNLAACGNDDLPQLHRHLEVLLLAFRLTPNHRDTFVAMNTPDCVYMGLRALREAQQDKSWAPVAAVAAALLCHVAVCTDGGVITLGHRASVGTLFPALSLFWDDSCVVTGIVATLQTLCTKNRDSRDVLATQPGVATLLGRLLAAYTTDGTVCVLISALLFTITRQQPLTCCALVHVGVLTTLAQLCSSAHQDVPNLAVAVTSNVLPHAPPYAVAAFARDGGTRMVVAQLNVASECMRVPPPGGDNGNGDGYDTASTSVLPRNHAFDTALLTAALRCGLAIIRTSEADALRHLLRESPTAHSTLVILSSVLNGHASSRRAALTLLTYVSLAREVFRRHEVSALALTRILPTSLVTTHNACVVCHNAPGRLGVDAPGLNLPCGHAIHCFCFVQSTGIGMNACHRCSQPTASALFQYMLSL